MTKSRTRDPFEADLLKFVARADYRPAKASIVLKRMRIPETEWAGAKRTIKRLIKEGKLVYGASHRVSLGSVVDSRAVGRADRSDHPPDRVRGSSLTSDPSLVTGRFHRTGAGNGYVRPSGTQPARGRTDDIYIPADRCGDAATGDIVLIKYHAKRRGPRGKRGVGEVEQIIERETHQFVGTYHEVDGVGMVQVDGAVFAQPVAVGDPGAKNAREGDKVVFEMVQFPTHTHAGDGVLTEVLGPRGEVGVDTLVVIRQYNLAEEFSEEALDEARQAAASFDGSINGNRRDLTDWPTLTIDPFDARDFDDAISVKRLENGHWSLGVHIADVAHFVQPRGPLDREARQRGTSVYLPTRVLPMLPEIISNSLASLQPHKVRYALTAILELTEDGARVRTELCQSAIQSDQRCTYEEVDQFLDDRSAMADVWSEETMSLLDSMRELAMILRNRRMERGALELGLPEIQLEFDADQRVCGAHGVEHTVSHQIIEEFMLAANEAVAERLHDDQFLFLRRIHEMPDPRKLAALTEFVRGIGIPVEGMESRFEIKRVLADVAGTTQEYAVNYAVLRSMQKAVYSPVDEGHYALASHCYCHFTSPIRRYPDLTIHRQIHAILGGVSPDNSAEHLIVLGEHCSEREQRAEAAERDLTKLKLLQFLATRIGTAMDAVITGVQDFGFFAQGLEMPAEGLVHVNSLPADRYDYDRVAHTLSGRRDGTIFRLGDVVRVEIAHVDLDRRELDLRLVKRRRRR